MSRARKLVRWLCPGLLWLCGALHAQEAPGEPWAAEAHPAGAAPAEAVAAEVVATEPVAPAPAAEPATVLMPAAEYDRGIASWYGGRFHGRLTASGEPFDMHALTAAHPTLPFGTIVRVRSLVNDQVVDVRINDRGPYAGGRIIDLSRAAAAVLGLIQSGAGTKPVQLALLQAVRTRPDRQRRFFKERRQSQPAGR